MITRYREEDKILYEGQTIFEEPLPLQMDFDDSDEFYNVKDGDSFPDIAWTVYGDARLYWVLVDYNAYTDPFAVPEPQTVLRYPTLRRLLAEVY